jgi:hypothetical protein
MSRLLLLACILACLETDDITTRYQHALTQQKAEENSMLIEKFNEKELSAE